MRGDPSCVEPRFRKHYQPIQTRSYGADQHPGCWRHEDGSDGLAHRLYEGSTRLIGRANATAAGPRRGCGIDPEQQQQTRIAFSSWPSRKGRNRMVRALRLALAAAAVLCMHAHGTSAASIVTEWLDEALPAAHGGPWGPPVGAPFLPLSPTAISH